MEKKYLDDAKIFKAFCDANRLMILKQLKSGEKCACVLLENLEIAQSTLSHHMKILTESEIVTAKKDGKWTYYSFSNEGVDYAKKIFSKLIDFNKS